MSCLKQVKELRRAALATEKSRLLAAGLDPTLEGHVAWTMPLGEGESPIESALRSITALEEYGVKPGELVFSHAMLNRYMDAVATRRIEPPKSSGIHPFVEHRRDEDGMWTRITPGGSSPTQNNE